jgi:hypothetical protein
MKKLLMLLVFILGSLMVSAQTKPFTGFFKPLPNDLFKNSNTFKKYKAVTATDTLKQGIWLFRFDATITAVQLRYSKDFNTWKSTPLSSVGPGIGYKHYISVDGKPYNNFGANLIALIGYDWDNEAAASKAEISLIGTVNFLEYVNIGGGYDFVNKEPVIVLGATLSF